jgi:hypothetical protein
MVLRGKSADSVDWPFGLAKPDSFLRCRARGAFWPHPTPLPFAAGANPKMVD